MKLLILNGPNLNLLGLREPELYGSLSYAELCERIERHAKTLGVEVSFFQSNHEGALIDRLHAAMGEADGIVFNPAAYTHTSVALLDALLAVRIPTVEVHLTELSKREPFRHTSYLRAACVKTIMGHGADGYLEAMDFLVQGGTPC